MFKYKVVLYTIEINSFSVDFMTQKDIIHEHAKKSFNETRRAKIAFDGKQFLVRFPKDIAEDIELKKGEEIEFEVDYSKPVDEQLKMKLVRVKK